MLTTARAVNLPSHLRCQPPCCPVAPFVSGPRAVSVGSYRTSSARHPRTRLRSKDRLTSRHLRTASVWFLRPPLIRRGLYAASNMIRQTMTLPCPLLDLRKGTSSRRRHPQSSGLCSLASGLLTPPGNRTLPCLVLAEAGVLSAQAAGDLHLAVRAVQHHPHRTLGARRGVRLLAGSAVGIRHGCIGCLEGLASVSSHTRVLGHGCIIRRTA